MADPEEQQQRGPDLYRTLVRALLAAAGLVVLLWFAGEVLWVLPVFFFAVVLAMVLSAPVTRLEGKGLNRVVATVLVAVAVLAAAGGIGWLVVPRVVEQAGTLVQDLPDYVARLREHLLTFFGGQPGVRQTVEDQVPANAGEAADMLPPLPQILASLGSYSLSVFGILALALVFVAIVLYMVARPRPLLALYVRSFPERLRDPAARAFARASTMCVGWMWSNVLAGAIEAVAVGVFLGLMGVPRAMLWAALAFFAELVPKIGLYLMATPPVLVALAVDPLTALWVALFYLVMNEIMGDFVVPRIRASTMSLHPASILLVMLAMAAAFGLAGALIATPVTAFIKAYYEEFYLARRPKDPRLDARVEAMLRREVQPLGS